MTNEERDLISQFVARVGGAAPGGFSRSVPTTAPALPPIDPEADRFIADQFLSHPEARYRITQMAVVQEAALAEAGNRIQQLQQALQQAQQAQQQSAAQPQSKGFFGGLFGGGAAQAQGPQQGAPWNQGGPQQQYAPPPQYAQQPNYPPNVQSSTFQRGGSGFLGSALTTAAGVAGGVVGANLLMDMFSGHSGGGGGMFGGGGGGFGSGTPQETIINNNYGNASDPGAGSWDNNAQSAPDPSWDNSQDPDNSGWDDNSGGGGGWDDNSNS
jgi:hypothetical protein